MSTLSILAMPVRSETGVASLCRRVAFLADAVGFGRPVQTRYVTAVSEAARWLAGQGGDGFTAHLLIETRGNAQYLAVRLASRSGQPGQPLATTPIAAVRRLVEIMEVDEGGSARLHLAQPLPAGGRAVGADDVAGWLDALEQKTEDTLRETTERLRLALETSHTGTWTWDIGDDTMMLDDQAHRIIGLKPHSLVGGLREFVAIAEPEDTARLAGGFKRAAHEGAEFQSEFRVRWPNGGERRIVARGMPVRDRQGAVRSLTGVCYDATDFLQDQERTRRRQKIESIGEMAGSMAHEINNLLQPIVSMAEWFSTTWPRAIG